MAKCVVDLATDCFVWHGSLDRKGYGVAKTGSTADGTRKMRRVHRIVWEAEHGLLPEGHVVHHDCENKRCCNIAHLRLMTAGEHSRHHDSAGKARKGLWFNQ